LRAAAVFILAGVEIIEEWRGATKKRRNRIRRCCFQGDRRRLKTGQMALAAQREAVNVGRKMNGEWF